MKKELQNMHVNDTDWGSTEIDSPLFKTKGTLGITVGT